MHCIMWGGSIVSCLPLNDLPVILPAGPRISRLCFVHWLFIQKLCLSAKGEMTMIIVYVTPHAYYVDPRYLLSLPETSLPCVQVALDNHMMFTNTPTMYQQTHHPK